MSTQDRFPPESADRYAAPPTGYRPDGRDALPTDRMARPAELEPDGDLVPRGATRAPAGLDMSGLAEPVYPPAAWMDGPSGSLADHPLLRGLLLELPPKGIVPPPGWLDRWFEAARSILELLYLQEGGRPR